MFRSKKNKKLCLICSTISLFLAASLPAQAVPIQVAITIDNSYALFFGTETEATTFVGSDYDWTTTEIYNFDLPEDHFLYVVTASDHWIAQGFLGQFENLDTGYKFYSSDPQWQVMATGLGTNAPYSGSATDLGLLTQEILDANAGGNPSGGWVAPTAGPYNGDQPWSLRPNIDSAARWVWYSSNGDPDPTTPGYNHDEWLVFRIPVDAAPVIEPSLWVLLATGLLSFRGMKRARWRQAPRTAA